MGDDDRPKLSWREIDQRRGAGRAHYDEQRQPRGRHAKVRAEAATKQYLSEIDKMFAGDKGGAEGAELAKAVRDAHGTSELLEACQSYRVALGLPDDPALISIFLDVNEPGLVAAMLEHGIALRAENRLEITAGLKSQLRVLAQDFDDNVAGAAEELLESA